MTYREYEQMINIIVGQVIFTNSLGDTEYHPERLDMLFKYFYLKNFEKYEFEKEYDFNFDMASMEYYEELKPILDGVKINPEHITEWSNIRTAVIDKIDFEKKKYLKRDNYSLTDAYLAGLLDKITTWIDDKGIEKLMTTLSEVGEEVGNKELQ